MLIFFNFTNCFPAFTQELQCDHEGSAYYTAEIFQFWRQATYTYAERTNYAGQPEKLFIDIYLPGPLGSDAGKERPVVMLLYGGGFREGARNATRILKWAEYYVKRGYVVAVPNYRIGWEGDMDGICGQGKPDDFLDAMYRAVQDIRTAVRFVKSKAGQLGADEESVFLKGISAGGIAALTWIYTSDTWLSEDRTLRLGPLDLPDEYEDMDHSVSGVVSIAGGVLPDFSLTGQDIPVLLLHGTCDHSVQFDEGRLLDCLQFPLFKGSLPLFEELAMQDRDVVLQAFCGFGHEFELNTAGPEDALAIEEFLNRTSVTFLHNRLCGHEMSAEIVTANKSFRVSPTDSCRYYEAYDICAGPEEERGYTIDIMPTHIKFSDRLFIKAAGLEKQYVRLFIFDAVGRNVYRARLLLQEGVHSIDLDWPDGAKGLHIVNIYTDTGFERLYKGKVVFEGELLEYLSD